MNKKLSAAEEFARMKHRGLKRKDGITPSIRHLSQVVKRLERMGVTEPDILSAAWLHDVVEDTDVTYDGIKNRFGRRVAEIVVAVSKDNRLPKRQRERQYISQLRRASFGAKLVKLGDIVANLADLEKSNYSRAKKIDAVRQKVRYLKAIRNGIRSRRQQVPDIGAIEDELNGLLEFYGQKRFGF